MIYLNLHEVFFIFMHSLLYYVSISKSCSLNFECMRIFFKLPVK